MKVNFHFILSSAIRSAKNKDFVLQLGADKHIDYHGYDWQNSAARFDMVLDTVGGGNFEKSLAVADSGATVISIPSGLSESVTEKAKAKGVNGFFFLVSSNGGHMTVIADWLRQGILKPHVSQTFGGNSGERGSSSLLMIKT